MPTGERNARYRPPQTAAIGRISTEIRTSRALRARRSSSSFGSAPTSAMRPVKRSRFIAQTLRDEALGEASAPFDARAADDRLPARGEPHEGLVAAVVVGGPEKERRFLSVHATGLAHQPLPVDPRADER